MKKRIFTFLLYRYQKGVVSKGEQQLVDQWYKSLENIEIPNTDTSSLNERRERSLQHTLAKITVKEPIGNQSNRLMWKWIPAAAALLVGLLFGTYWYTTRNLLVEESQHRVAHTYRLFETQVGERKQIVLPDGSTVVLNARSSMRIDEQQFGNINRTVELLQGEAFFDVQKDSSRAFIVLTDALRTEVLGTSFNIQAYAEMPEQVISVYTGRVQVQRGEQTLGILRRGEQIRFQKDQKNSAIEEFRVENNKGWVSGRTMLRQASFAELSLAVQNNYGLVLKAANTRIVRQQYSMPIQERVPLQDALKAICDIHKNKSRKEGDTVLIY